MGFFIVSWRTKHFSGKNTFCLCILSQSFNCHIVMRTGIVFFRNMLFTCEIIFPSISEWYYNINDLWIFQHHSLKIPSNYIIFVVITFGRRLITILLRSVPMWVGRAYWTWVSILTLLRWSENSCSWWEIDKREQSFLLKLYPDFSLIFLVCRQRRRVSFGWNPWFCSGNKPK